MQKQSFAKGALILMTANAISKILGAVFKIPLTYILKEEGMAVYNTAFTVYIMFLVFVLAGIPTAVSKKTAQSDERGAFLITDVSEKLLLAAGIAASAALYFGADFFAAAMREKEAAFAIKLSAPAVLFVALGTGYKSFFHGSSSMITPAVSQITESAIKLCAGYVFALALVKLGYGMGAAGAIAGVTAGEIIATAILAVGYFKHRFKVRLKASRGEKREYMRELIGMATPLLIAETAMNAVSVTDTSVLRNGMLAAGLSEEKARFLYGSFSGYAMTIFNLPAGILGTVGISLLTAVASANSRLAAQRVVDKGIELTMFIGIPSAVAMWLIPDVMLDILFENTSSAQMLRYMAPCVVTVSLVQLYSAVIQASMNVVIPSVIETIGLIIKIFIMGYLCSKPEINIYGAIIGSNVAYFLMTVAEIICLKKYAGINGLRIGSIIKACISATVMAAVIIYAKGFLNGGVLSKAALCAAGGAAYVAVYGILCNVSKKRKFKETLD